MTENKNVELVEVPELTQRDKVETYIRSTFLLGSFNFERMQSIGFAVSMIPAIKRFYTKKEDQAEALTRHLEFFNTQPWVASSIMGVTAAMEREKAAGKDIDEAAITNVKVGLMGPLAGVGDPIYWGTARIVLAALGASLAVTGNILGPLLFFFGLTAIRWATRWYGFKYGYEKGTQIVTEAGGNTLQKITQGASVMGLFVMGALVYRWTSVKHSVAANQLQEPGWRDGGCDRSVGAERPAAGPCVAGPVLPVHVAAEEEGQRYLVDFRSVRRGHPRFLPGIPGPLKI